MRYVDVLIEEKIDSLFFDINVYHFRHFALLLPYPVNALVFSRNEAMLPLAVFTS
jgi:hypothetical protein